MKFRRDYMEGEEFPKQWLSFGKCIPTTGKKEHEFSYFLLRLPSYRYHQIDCYSGHPVWLQTVVLCFNGRWRVIEAYA